MTPIETAIRHDWTVREVEALFQLPFNDLVFQAQLAHRRYFDPNQVQIHPALYQNRCMP